MSCSHESVTFPGGYSPEETKGECEFNRTIAANALRFFRKHLRHVKGQKAGQPLRLRRWQRNIIAALFGWRRPDGTRRYRLAYIEIPRKAGKSTLASGIALLLLYCDDEPGAEVYSCASDREQAAIVFDIAKANVKRNKMLDGRSKVYQRSIVHFDPKTGVAKGSYKVLSAEAASKHGYNPSGIIFDELHAQPSPDLWEVMKTGTGARRQALTVAITTAGFDRNSICWQVRQQAVLVRDGVAANESVLPVIYGADPDDDWSKEETWYKAQPNLGISVPISFYRDEFLNAKQSPQFENAFRRLYLDQWTEQAVRWLNMESWDKCGDPLPVNLGGEACWCGLDLSSTVDLAAMAMVFRLPDEKYAVKMRFWIPGNAIREKSMRDHVDYDHWIKQDLITPTPGDFIDHGRIRDDIVALGLQYSIQEIAIDPYNAAQITVELRETHGFNAFTFRQGYLTMSPAAKDFHRAVLGRKLIHGGNLVLRWNAQNVTIQEDGAENIKPIKDKYTGRIDGIVAAIMGLSRAMVGQGSSLTGQLFFSGATT